MTVFGALNLNARNFEVELRRAGEKLENGMSGFLTQPVPLGAGRGEPPPRPGDAGRAGKNSGRHHAGGQPAERDLHGERSQRHPCGRGDHPEAFAGLDREQGEALGLEISLKMAREALPYADGFYLMTPFNRVALMERLIARLKTELLQEQ